MFFRVFSAAFLVGAIDVLTIYAFGFFDFKGPLILLTWLGAATLVGLMNFPSRSGCVIAIPLTFVGFGFAALISMSMGIGWM